MSPSPVTSPIALTPEPPYYAVIFTSVRTADDDAGYGAAAAAMDALSRQQSGFLGIESARGVDGLGITVSYWASEDAMRNWKLAAEHLGVQRMGRERWYAAYTTRIARVERAYTMETSARVGL